MSQQGALKDVYLKHRCEVRTHELCTGKPYLDRRTLGEILVKERRVANYGGTDLEGKPSFPVSAVWSILSTQ